MAKKTDTSNIANLGKGILDTITSAGIKEESSKGVKEETGKGAQGTIWQVFPEENNKTPDAQENHSLNADKNNSVKEQKSKKSKDSKSKRSFMLPEATIQRLNLMKLCMSDKDFSTIVDDAINLYFEKNKGSIEALISIYNKVK